MAVVQKVQFSVNRLKIKDMKTKNFKQMIFEAHFRGAIFAKDGKMCRPALDKEFNDFTFTIPIKYSIRLCEEWIRGYHTQMLYG